MAEKKNWSCFVDASYYDQWAVKNAENNSFYSVIHVRTEGEAKFLVEKLNELDDTKSRAEEAETALGYLWRAREEKHMRGVNEKYKQLKSFGWDLTKEVMRNVKNYRKAKEAIPREIASNENTPGNT